jgi:hypothetical protein
LSRIHWKKKSALYLPADLTVKLQEKLSERVEASEKEILIILPLNIDPNRFSFTLHSLFNGFSLRWQQKMSGTFVICADPILLDQNLKYLSSYLPSYQDKF